MSFLRSLFSKLLISIPEIIDATKYFEQLTPAPSATIDGPGQAPANPQPNPNIAEPATSGKSTFIFDESVPYLIFFELFFK